jgi:PAS domain S-box-containing protein
LAKADPPIASTFPKDLIIVAVIAMVVVSAFLFFDVYEPIAEFFSQLDQPEGVDLFLASVALAFCLAWFLYRQWHKAIIEIGARKRIQTELKESEQRYRNIFDGSRDAIFIARSDASFVEVNQAACDLTGYSRDELLSMRIPDLHDRRSLNVFEKAFHRIMAGESIVTEAKLSRKDGRTIFVEFSNQRIFLAGRYHLYTAVRDKTAEKAGEAALVESESRYRRLTENARDIVWRADVDGTVIYVNRAVERILGWTAAEATGQRLSAYLSEESISMAMGRIQDANQIVPPATHFRAEVLYQHQNGRPVPCEMQVTIVRDAQDNIEAFEGITRDISSRKKAERAIRESEARYRLLTENITDVIWTADLSGKVTYWSPAVTELLGYSHEEAVQIPLESLFTQQSMLLVRQKLKQWLENSPLDLGPQEYQMWRKDGSKVWVEIQASLLRDGDDAPMEILGVARDVSSQRKARESLVKTRNQLEARVKERTEDLRKANLELLTEISERRRIEETLREYQKRLRSLASQISLVEARERKLLAHDLHDHLAQNLALIKVQLEVHRASIDKNLDIESLNQALELIGNTIQDTRSLTFELSPPILYEFGLEAAVEFLLNRVGQQHELRTELVAEEGRIPLREDVAVLLFRAVRELMINVTKHSNAAVARVAIRKEKNNLMVKVSDNGIGFDLDQVSARMKQGRGFGLFSIHERVRSIGGLMTIDARPNEGTWITITMPLEYVQ